MHAPYTPCTVRQYTLASERARARAGSEALGAVCVAITYLSLHLCNGDLLPVIMREWKYRGGGGGGGTRPRLSLALCVRAKLTFTGGIHAQAVSGKAFVEISNSPTGKEKQHITRTRRSLSSPAAIAETDWRDSVCTPRLVLREFTPEYCAYCIKNLLIFSRRSFFVSFVPNRFIVIKYCDFFLGRQNLNVNHRQISDRYLFPSREKNYIYGRLNKILVIPIFENVEKNLPCYSHVLEGIMNLR